jgi:hypothetical protein
VKYPVQPGGAGGTHDPQFGLEQSVVVHGAPLLDELTVVVLLDAPPPAPPLLDEVVDELPVVVELLVVAGLDPPPLDELEPLRSKT